MGIPRPRINQLGVQIVNDSAKMKRLRQDIDELKARLSVNRHIFARNFQALDFGSTIQISGKLYASFKVERKVLEEYCRNKGIVAELDPIIAFFQDVDAEEEVIRAMHIPIMDGFDFIIDVGNERLMIDNHNEDAVAVKFIERGYKIDENLTREIIDHRSLKHPNIVRFKEVILTPTHLAIVMEHATGGELYDRVTNKGPFHENKARHLFQQLIYGVCYCHSMQLCHRDLKLKNILLDGSLEPRLKICYFDYSKASELNSRRSSRVERPAYVAPEVFVYRDYDGKAADVLSCGVILYEMLVGAFPFKLEYTQKPKDLLESIRRMIDVGYSFPAHVNISVACRDLISRILVQDPAKRITMPGIKNHVWFLKDLPVDLVDETTGNQSEKPMQSLEVIMQIISEAKTPIHFT